MVILDNILPFTISQPEVTGNPGIVFVDLAVTIEPIVIFAAINFNPSNQK